MQDDETTLSVEEELAKADNEDPVEEVTSLLVILFSCNMKMLLARKFTNRNLSLYCRFLCCKRRVKCLLKYCLQGIRRYAFKSTVCLCSVAFIVFLL